MSENWTILSLKEYFERRLTDMEKAVTKAEAAHERRLEGMNEFRNQLKDQQQTFVDKSYYNSQHAILEEKIRDVKLYIDKLDARKEGGNIVWAYVVSGISLFLALLSFALTLIK